MSAEEPDFDLQAVQDFIGEAGFDGWLFARFHGPGPLATRVLISPEGAPELTGRKQEAMILLLADDPRCR